MSIEKVKDTKRYAKLKSGTIVSDKIHFSYGSFGAGTNQRNTSRDLEACGLHSRPVAQRHFVAIDFEGIQLYARVNDEQLSAR